VPEDADYRGRRVCVTGGAGFIGSHLCAALVERGAEVTALDDLSNGRVSNLAPVADRVRLIRGSLLDRAELESAVAGAEIVFHLAAIASVPRSVAEPGLYLEVNGTGTLLVLEAARAAGARRVVFAASSSAYGDQPGLPRVETMPPDVRSPYAAAKCTGEYMMRAFAQCYDLSTVSLRYFNIFGPRQRSDSPYAAVIPRFAAALLAGERPVVYGDGTQTRDFTHVSNAVHANLLAGASPRPLAGEVVNIACGHGTSVLDLVAAIARRLDASPDVTLAPPRAGEVTHSVASIDAARGLLGYEPITAFEDGLARTLEYYVSSRA
jgi:UDP-glucose 4-epimerase